MAEINEAHPLWEPAAVLYGAWVKTQGWAQIMSPQFHNAHDHVCEGWIAIAQVAKDLFDEYQDELVDKIDQIHAVVRESVSATKWEKISRKLALADEPNGWNRHPSAFVHHDPELRKAEEAAARYGDSGMAAQANLGDGLPGKHTRDDGEFQIDLAALSDGAVDQIMDAFGALLPYGTDPKYDFECEADKDAFSKVYAVMAARRSSNPSRREDPCPDCGTFQTTPHSEHPLTAEQRKGHAEAASTSFADYAVEASARINKTLKDREQIVGGPAVLPGTSPFTFSIDPAGSAKRSAEHAHARIDALQREVAWHLARIEAYATGKDSNKQLAAGRSEEILAFFQRADERVRQGLQ